MKCYYPCFDGSTSNRVSQVTSGNDTKGINELKARPLHAVPCRQGIGRRETLFDYDGNALTLPELKLISRIRSQTRRQGVSRQRYKPVPKVTGQIVAGIGDDCSVLRIPRNHEILITTDLSLEGVHFVREWHPAQLVGHRCLTRGLSDIAAMGGEPLAAFLSLGLPARLPQKWTDQFMKGLLKLAAQFNVTLAGGDTSQSPTGVLADIVVAGSVPRGKAILRSTAGVGDRIYVTGEVGGAAAELGTLYSKGKRDLKPSRFSSHFLPVPRIDVGRTLRRKGIATSMIDLSDGLSTDLRHICEESGVGAQVSAEAVPRATRGRSGLVDLQLALHGGEDYELLFTAPAGKRVPDKISGVRITEIGRITRSRSVTLIGGGAERELEPKGWQHFARSGK